MEGFLEFIIYGFLNAYFRDVSTNGEILGLVLAFICIVLAFFLLNSLIWSIFFKDEI
jgi:ABC-type lipoprotein release transport system permease subunit